MKYEPKLRGQSGKVSPLTRLKELAGKKPAIADELWAWHGEAELTNAAIRGRIEARFGITLSRDGQLSDFWSWLSHKRREENYNDIVARFEDFYAKAHPNASRDRVRDMGIAFFMAEAVQDQDEKKFNVMANLDLRDREGKTKAELDVRKVSVSERRVKVLEEAAERARKTEAVLDSNISAEDQAKRIREIFKK